MGRNMFEGRAVESPKDGVTLDGDVEVLDLGAVGNPGSVPARLEFCVVRSLLGAFAGDIQRFWRGRWSLIYC